MGVNATPELVARTQAEFGTDRPLLTQYFDWAFGLPFGDFGISYVTHQDISPLVLDRVQVSLILVLLAMIVALLIAVPFGTLAAVRHRNPRGIVISGLSQVGVAVPAFLAGILLVIVFAVGLGWLPGERLDTARARTPRCSLKPGVPARRWPSASCRAPCSPGTSAARCSTCCSEDYLRTARAKGLGRMRRCCGTGCGTRRSPWSP